MSASLYTSNTLASAARYSPAAGKLPSATFRAWYLYVEGGRTNTNIIRPACGVDAAKVKRTNVNAKAKANVKCQSQMPQPKPKPKRTSNAKANAKCQMPKPNAKCQMPRCQDANMPICQYANLSICQSPHQIPNSKMPNPKPHTCTGNRGQPIIPFCLH